MKSKTNWITRFIKQPPIKETACPLELRIVLGSLLAGFLAAGGFGCRGILGENSKLGHAPETEFPPRRLRIKPELFLSDGAVLQQADSIEISGYAENATDLHLRFGGLSRTARADRVTGEWSCAFPGVTPGGPYTLEISSPEGFTTVSNLLVGDRWLLAGNVGSSPHAEATGKLPEATVFAPRVFRSRDLSERGVEPRNKWRETFAPALISTVSASVTNIPLGIIDLTQTGWTVPEDPAQPFEGEETIAGGSTRAGKDACWIEKAARSARGVLWFDRVAGKTDASPSPGLFTNILSACRESLASGNLFWLTVQTDAGGDGKGSGDAPGFRETWARTARLFPSSEVVWNVDLGEHWYRTAKGNHESVRRISRALRALAYGQDVAWRGPRPRTVRLEIDRLRVTFDDPLGTGLRLLEGDTSTQIEVAGADRRFLPARIRLEKNALLAWHAEIAEPLHIRHAWKASPGKIRLVNSKGLPVEPFNLSVGIEP